MAFTVKTKKHGGGDTYGTESNAISYQVRWVMNDMASAIVTLNDANFASTQAYMDLTPSTDVYVGYGPGGVGSDENPGILIEDPTGTEIFEGFIHKVVADPRAGVVRLHCYDLLYQLSKERIVYDTRANLTGGIRESEPYRMSGTGEHGIVDVGGPGPYRLYDTIAGWANNTFHGGDTHYIIFANKMAGKQEFWHGVKSFAITGNASATAGDLASTWPTEPDEVHTISSDNNGDDWDGLYKFQVYADYTKVTQIDLEYSISSPDVSGIDLLELQVYNHRRSGSGLAAGWYTVKFWDDTTFSETTNKTIDNLTDLAAKIGVDDPGDLISTDEDVHIQFTMDSDAADKGELSVYLLKLTVHVEGVTANTTAYEIDADGASYVEVSEDLLTAGIDKHCKYSISRVVTKYVADLVTTYDAVHTLDASTDVVASTNVVGRHYHYMTPLDILKDLAEADGTEFWLDDGDDLHWNDAYATGGAPTITDSDVIYWSNPVLTLDGLGNSIVVLGQRYEDTQGTGTSSDATSTDQYGTYTLVVENPAISAKKDADDQATALKTWYKDPAKQMGYTVNGLSTYDIGKVVKINSTDLAITNIHYIVTEKRYNSAVGVTDLILTLRSTSGLFRPFILEDGISQIRSDVADTKRYQAFTPLHTETWS